MSGFRVAAVALLSLTCSCLDEGPDNDPFDLDPRLSELRKVVPSDGLDQIRVQRANNNLDIVRHDGRLFLAFRTAPTHFASSDVTLHVVSTTDEVTWQSEASFNLDRDLREPRLLSWEGKLFLYFAALGTNPLAFEPGEAKLSEYMGPGDWTEPEDFYLPGFIPWRTKTIDGKPYMMGYVGGGNIYPSSEVNSEERSFNEEDAPADQGLEVHWLTTTDGREWQPVVEGQPVVYRGGASETDFAFLDDGSLIAVMRNEAGDELGWGSLICTAPADDLGNWACEIDPVRYDSPLLFIDRTSGVGQPYLIGRRNIDSDGDTLPYDLFRREKSASAQSIEYQLRYWQRAKRCALWLVDPAARSVSFELDLPSRGDTCFAGLVELGDSRYLIYNYTSPLEGDDVAWVRGQLGPTEIYRQVLDLSVTGE